MMHCNIFHRGEFVIRIKVPGKNLSFRFVLNFFRTAQKFREEILICVSDRFQFLVKYQI